MGKILGLAIALLMIVTAIKAQNQFVFHTESVDSLLSWMDRGCDKGSMAVLTRQPATQLMEQLLKKQEEQAPDFKSVLATYHPGDSLSGSAYLLNTAYKRQADLKQLLDALQGSNFSEEVYNRVLSYFPEDYEVPRTYEVFFTATGWKWGDAMTFRYTPNGGAYTLSQKGIPAMIFNLTLVAELYGKTLEQRLKTMKNVMAHELFHAVLSDYKNAHWKFWEQNNIEQETMYIMFNEGFAHYLADKEKLDAGYASNGELKTIENKAFQSLSDSISVVFDGNQPKKARINAVRSGTYGKYWNKYICISSLFMAYHLEEAFGKAALKECIVKGPHYFMKKYDELQRQRTELPAIPVEMIGYIESINN